MLIWVKLGCPKLLIGGRPSPIINLKSGALLRRLAPPAKGVAIYEARGDDRRCDPGRDQARQSSARPFLRFWNDPDRSQEDRPLGTRHRDRLPLLRWSDPPPGDRHRPGGCACRDGRDL